MLPKIVTKKLNELGSMRTNIKQVSDAIIDLDVSVPKEFEEFYTLYTGPFGSRATGFELLDICEDDTNIIQSTHIARSRFDFRKTT